MGNSNDGRVEGATYVGGVVGKNDAAITGAVNDMVGIENNGVVIAHKGGAGGIFGENTGDIKYAELTNNGIVSGTYSNNDVAGTGGILVLIVVILLIPVLKIILADRLLVRKMSAV